MRRSISCGVIFLTGLLAGCGDDLPDLDFRQEMVDLVAEISEYAKSKDSTFYIFSHNAVERWSEYGYLEAVDGIGQEDAYYGYGIATPAEVTY